jgi:hypothetical protein
MSQNKYSVGKVKKLIDLNDKLVNFDLTFSASCKEGIPFDALVVDQNTLDSNPNLEYKKASNGKISGHLVSDKNNYQNFFLILKSDVPCDVDVIINRKEIEPQPQPQPQPETYVNNASSNSNSFPPASKINFKLILLTIIVVAGLFFLWYYFNKYLKNKSKKVEGNLNNTSKLLENTSPVLKASSPIITDKQSQPIVLSSPRVTPNLSPLPPNPLKFPSTANAKLIARLNSLS